ncbi:hypothetical protein [Geomonas anaerohicana]|uniref:Uncharacterized protein n=1 Tax=Geomonas anaerohicana TaxID=2798583 RepID=A0ABS0YC79_9BACT|nr:hypothetical protein [Geomonas anaerohicana]MBJ6749917.1 hypothetical protein [Geomonas anaerohicana]
MLKALSTQPHLIKTFLLLKRWWQAGILNTLVDDLYFCQEVFWLEDLHSPEDKPKSISIVDMTEWARDGEFLLPYKRVTVLSGGKASTVALADLVTYPGMSFSHNDLPLNDYAPWDQLLKVNFQILAPYLKRLGPHYSLVTTVHTNFHSEHGSEYDAPCHNLINCVGETLDAFDDLSKFLQEAPNRFLVTGSNPIMDDRHPYLERCHGEPRRLPPYRFKTIFSDAIP